MSIRLRELHLALLRKSLNIQGNAFYNQNIESLNTARKMATPLPPNSCFSCQDSGLSTTASIAGILTFLYALTAGLFLYSKSIANSRAEMESLRESLDLSVREAKRSLELMFRRLGDTPGGGPFGHELEVTLERVDAQSRSIASRRELRDWGPASRRKKVTRSLRFVAMREDLMKQIVEKDKMMDNLWRVQEQSVLANP